MTLLDLFDGARRDRSRAPAVNGVSYDELAAATLRVAWRLADRGLARGDRFALYCENRLGFVYAYLAALRLGAVVVPVNVLYRAAELQHVLSNARVNLALVSAQTAEHLDRSAFEVPAVTADAVEAWAEESVASPELEAAPRDDDLALILYTSGTTGRSKGAMLTHGNLAAIARIGRGRLALATGRRARDRRCRSSTCTVSARRSTARWPRARISSFTNASTRGACSIDCRRRRDDVLRRADDVRALARSDRLAERAAFAPLRVGLGALPAEVHGAFEERFGIDILERYGASEFGFALGNRYGGPRVAGSVGVPMPGVRVRIVAPGGMRTPCSRRANSANCWSRADRVRRILGNAGSERGCVRAGRARHALVP